MADEPKSAPAEYEPPRLFTETEVRQIVRDEVARIERKTLSALFAAAKQPMKRIGPRQTVR